MSDADPESGPARDPPEPALAASVAGVIDAALGVGVSLARLMAEATATEHPVSPLPRDTPAIQAIVRYGVTALSNVAQAIVSGAQGLRKAAPGAASAPASAAAQPGGPRVQAGAVLRVPLSVENPGERPMTGLRPVARRVRAAGGADARPLLPLEDVSFSPQLFDVAPHDFEKLVVQVPLSADLPAGGYELTLALGDEEPDLPVSFTVLPR